MLRFTALFLAGCIAAIGMLAASSREPAPALACTPSIDSFEDLVRLNVRFVVLADVVEAGGPENSVPPSSPTPTSSPTATDTPAPSATRTPKPSATPRTRTPKSPPPTPTNTPLPYYDLTGMRATLDVVQAYSGSPPPSPFVIDAERRALFERDLRFIETHPSSSSCGPYASPRYSVGAHYVVLAAQTSSGSAATFMRLRVEGDDVVMCDRARPGELSCPRMRGATYRRLFAGVEARIDPGNDQDFATITAARMPLVQFVSAIEAIRNGGNITPPETGSAGLAAHRR